ncbi:MAG: hypothetical protein ACOC5T_01045 [Elusimicrobiota bacterium]
MSTRCNVKIVRGDSELWFYRHSDGYPSETLPSLKKFMRWVESGAIRRNVTQASGWLVMIGAKEYNYYHDERRRVKKESLTEPCKKDLVAGWKVGAYEPTTGLHGDVNFVYECDLKNMEIRIYEGNGETKIETIDNFEEKE